MKSLVKLYPKSLIILFISGLISSCGQTDSSSTKVTISMPYLSNSLSAIKSDQLLTAKSSADNPSQINDINCFAIMVGSADPILSRTSCQIKKDISIYDVSGTTSVNIGEKKVGIIKGLVPSGGKITLDVPAGSNRIFTLIGLKASAIEACVDFTDPNANFDLISDPFIVGESAPVNLESGVEVTVPIKLPASGTAFTSESPRIGDCTGPDAPGKNQVIPTKAIITKNFFPFANFVADTCNPLNIEFIDNNGRNGDLQENFTANISYTAASGSTNVSSGNLTYYASSDNNCAGASSTGTIAFDKSLNARNKTIFFKATGPASATNYTFSINSFSATKFPNFTSESFQNNSTTTAAIDVSGTNRVISDVCYNMKGAVKYVSGEVVTSSSSSTFQVNAPDLQARVFTGSDCNILNLITPISVSAGSQSSLVSNSGFDFSMKFTNTPYTKSYIQLKPIVGGGVSTTTITYPVEIFGGVRNPAVLDVNMYNTFPSTGGYSGPFQVMIMNERGGAVPISTGSIAITVSPTALTSSIFIKNADASNYYYINETISPTESYRKQFQIYTNALSPSTQADIIFTATVIHPLKGSQVVLKKVQRIKFQ